MPWNMQNMMISVFKASAKEGSHKTIVFHKITTCPPSFLIYKLCCTVQFSDSDVLPIHFLRRKCSKCVLAVIVNVSFQTGNDTTQCQPVIFFQENDNTNMGLQDHEGLADAFHASSNQQIISLLVPQRLQRRSHVSTPNSFPAYYSLWLQFHGTGILKPLLLLEKIKHDANSLFITSSQQSFQRLTASYSDNVVCHFRCTPQNSCLGGNRSKISSSACDLFSATWVL